MKHEIFTNEELNRVEFKDSRFYQTWQDPNKYVPGLTSVLNCYPKGKGYEQWLKENGKMADIIALDAMEKGSIIHNLTERYEMGEEIRYMDDHGRALCSMEEWSAFHNYLEFCDRYEPDTIAVEWRSGSLTLGYGGTLDRVMELQKGPLQGQRGLWDIKTGKYLYDYYSMQLIGYKWMWEELNPKYPIDYMAILWLNSATRTNGNEKKGAMQGNGWQVKIISPVEVVGERTLDWEKKLISTLDIWEGENPNYKPDSHLFHLSIQKGVKREPLIEHIPL